MFACVERNHASEQGEQKAEKRYPSHKLLMVGKFPIMIIAHYILRYDTYRNIQLITQLVHLLVTLVPLVY